MGDFNFDPKNRHVTSYNKRKLDLILDLEACNLFDNTQLVYDITTNTPHNTWFKNNSQIASRIDMIWCSEQLSTNLIEHNLIHTELYGYDQLLISSTYTTNFFNFKNRVKLRQ